MTEFTEHQQRLIDKPPAVDEALSDALGALNTFALQCGLNPVPQQVAEARSTLAVAQSLNKGLVFAGSLSDGKAARAALLSTPQQVTVDDLPGQKTNTIDADFMTFEQVLAQAYGPYGRKRLLAVVWHGMYSGVSGHTYQVTARGFNWEGGSLPKAIEAYNLIGKDKKGDTDHD